MTPSTTAILEKPSQPASVGVPAARHWRWLDAGRPLAPDLNMAIDTLLFERMQENSDEPPTMRFYQWDRPSVTFGRLQQEEAVRAQYPNLPLVRRPTGGRA